MLFYKVILFIFGNITFNLKFVYSQGLGTPPVPKNAKLLNVTNVDGIIEAKYSCDSGYEMFGANIVRFNKNSGWETQVPVCCVNVAVGKPTNQSSNSRLGHSQFANDGNSGFMNPDEMECSETLKEVSPWWKADLLVPEVINAVRITTRICCGFQLQDVEIRVGNSSDLRKNRLCAWFPGTLREGKTETLLCARPLIGRFVFIQLVGIESSLSLCEVEIFSSSAIPINRCFQTNTNTDTYVTTFKNICFEFHTQSGKKFSEAQKFCQKNGGNLINNFLGPTSKFITSILEQTKDKLKTNLIWIGATKEEGITSRNWKWITGNPVFKPPWGKDQPNNYNGEQNCVVLDGGRNWFWNDVGCNLDYLLYICQYEPHTCGSPALSENLTISSNDFRIGKKIKYECLAENALIGNNVSICENDAIWSGSLPLCKYIDCGRLPPLENGNISFNSTKFTYGTVADFTCNENYTIIGNKRRICSLNGWSGSQPTCVFNWCSDPPNVFAGTVEITGNQLNSKAIYNCDKGYILSGESVITCELGGQWSSKPPVCKFIDCGAPARPDRGTVVLLNDSTFLGSVALFSCDENYWLIGSAKLQCLREGKWSDESPNCELITCEAPMVPTGSYVTGYDYNVHSIITYHCDPGYILKGEQTLQCLLNGEWSSGPPTCEYIDCGIIDKFHNGEVEYLKNTTYLGSSITFTCKSAYKLIGAENLTCLENGNWSESLPSCEEIRCPEPVLAAHSILSITGNDRVYGRTLIRTSELSSQNQSYKIGALAKYRCERGYKIVGDPLITCTELGVWSGVIPECIYVDCGKPVSIKNGKTILTTNATYYGAILLYECNENFKLVGVSRRICLEDATWNHEEPECQPIICEDLQLTNNLEILNIGPKTVGSYIEFKCAKGRKLIGNMTRTCLKTGFWSGKLPICQDVDCGAPASIQNGRVIVINDTTSYGGSAEYHCLPNFVRNGPFLRKCLEDGLWSGDQPNCILVSMQEAESNLNTGIILGSSIIIIVLIILTIVFLYRNKQQPVKNSENVQAAETKEDRNASVVSYSTISKEHVYDEAEQWQYETPYEIKNNDEVYEPEPYNNSNPITINGLAVR